MNRVEHCLILMRPCNCEHLGVGPSDVLGLGAEAARDDHPAVLVKGLSDGLEALGLGRIEKTAGVHDDGFGA